MRVIIWNGELDRIHDWLCANRLSLNKDKTSYMVFSNTNSHPTNDIKIGGYKIDQVESSKYLGIIIDSDLSFRHHIGHVLQKISASLGVLRRLFLYTPKHILRTIYLSLIYPYLMYGVEVWGGSDGLLLRKVRRQQDKCLRMCSVAATNDNILKMYTESRLLPFEEIFKYFIRIKFYQYHRLQRNIFLMIILMSFAVVITIRQGFPQLAT